jgi:hypothetical protein
MAQACVLGKLELTVAPCQQLNVLYAAPTCDATPILSLGLCAGMQVPLDQTGVNGLCVIDSDSFSARRKVLLKLLLQLCIGPVLLALYALHKLQLRCSRVKDQSVFAPIMTSAMAEEGSDSFSSQDEHAPHCPGRLDPVQASDVGHKVGTGWWPGAATPPQHPRQGADTHPVAALGPRTDGWLLAATPPPCPGCRHHSAALLPLGARKWAAAVNFFLTAYAVLLVSLLRVVTCVGVPGTQSSKRFVLIQGDVQCLVGVWGQVIFAVLGVVVGPLLVWAAAAWSRAGSMTGDSDGTRNRRLGLRNALTACYKEDKYECGVGWRAAGCSAVVF